MSPNNNHLKPFKSIDSDAEQALPPEKISQLNKVAKQYKNKRGHIVLFKSGTSTIQAASTKLLGSLIGHEVYQVDLAGIDSSYIGETEKNLLKLFKAAEDLEAVLFFDEADSLFGKRAEVNSANNHYNNMDINSLLQRIEAYKGLIILNSISDNGLEDKVIKQVDWVIEFVTPPVKLRYHWWRHVFKRFLDR